MNVKNEGLPVKTVPRVIWVKNLKTKIKLVFIICSKILKQLKFLFENSFWKRLLFQHYAH